MFIIAFWLRQKNSISFRKHVMMLEQDKLYCIDLTMIYKCAEMPLEMGLFMVSGAVQGYDLSHTFTHRLSCFPTH